MNEVKTIHEAVKKLNKLSDTPEMDMVTYALIDAEKTKIKRALSEILKKGWDDQVKSWDYKYNIRRKYEEHGSTKLSDDMVADDMVLVSDVLEELPFPFVKPIIDQEINFRKGFINGFLFGGG